MEQRTSFAPMISLQAAAPRPPVSEIVTALSAKGEYSLKYNQGKWYSLRLLPTSMPDTAGVPVKTALITGGTKVRRHALEMGLKLGCRMRSR